MQTIAVPRPEAGEYAPYYDRYIQLVLDEDALQALIGQIDRTTRLLQNVSEEKAAFRYAPGKWSVKQVVGHVADAERVFSYRAMRVGRADATPLPGFDENHYVANGGFDDRSLADLVLELRAVRSATIALFASLRDDALLRRGTANDSPITPRAVAWMIAGHELHHRSILIERYGIVG
jgi:uncharacterized damage-inducible protein DinB